MEARRQAEKPLARKHRKGVPRVFGRSGPVGRSGAYVVHVARCLFQCLSRSSVWPAVLLSLAAAAEWLPSPWDCATLCVSPVSPHRGISRPSFPPTGSSLALGEQHTPRAHAAVDADYSGCSVLSSPSSCTVVHLRLRATLSTSRIRDWSTRVSSVASLPLCLFRLFSLSLSLSSARLFPFLCLSLLYVVDRFI